MEHGPATMTVESPSLPEGPVFEFSEHPNRRQADRIGSRNPVRIQSALSLLLDAAACADDVGADVWQFSVELSALRRLGLTANECRWLIAKGFVKHACETT